MSLRPVHDDHAAGAVGSQNHGAIYLREAVLGSLATHAAQESRAFTGTVHPVRTLRWAAPLKDGLPVLQRGPAQPWDDENRLRNNPVHVEALSNQFEDRPERSCGACARAWLVGTTPTAEGG